MEIRSMESKGAFDRAFCKGEVPEGSAGWVFPLDEGHFARWWYDFEWGAVVTWRSGGEWSESAGRFCMTRDGARAWLEAYDEDDGPEYRAWRDEMEIRVMESEEAFDRAFCEGEATAGRVGWVFPLGEGHPARAHGFGWSAVVTWWGAGVWVMTAGRFCETRDSARAWLEAYGGECR